jgi:hypothetical protein
MNEINLSELRILVRDLLEEEGPGQVPPSAALPPKGALYKFRADVNMMTDAAGRAKAAVESASTQEALRWIDKVAAFAASAKAQLIKLP